MQALLPKDTLLRTYLSLKLNYAETFAEIFADIFTTFMKIKFSEGSIMRLIISKSFGINSKRRLIMSHPLQNLKTKRFKKLYIGRNSLKMHLQGFDLVFNHD